MSDKNNTKSNAFGVIIDPEKKSTNPYYELAQLQTTLLGRREFFVATIIHDKDKDSDNLPKTTHLHAYLESSVKYTKKQFLELISGFLSIDPIRVSVKTDNNGFLLVQYLTHKNDPNKHQYSVDQVATNNADLFQVKYSQTYINPAERAERLQYDIENAKTLLAFISVQGLDNAKKYQQVFNQVKKEQHLDLDRFANTIDKLDLFIDWLEERKRILTENTDQQAQARLDEFMLVYGEIKTRFREFFRYRNN